MGETDSAKAAPLVPRRETAMLLAILILAVALRMWGIGSKSFWVDEVLAVERSRSLRQALAYCATNHEPPLRYYLVHYLARFQPPELSVRLPSFLFGVATIGVLWLLVRRWFGPREAMVAAFLLAISPWHIEQSQDARMYAVMMFFWALSLILFFDALEKPAQPLRWPALAVVHAVNFYLSYLTAFVLAAEVLTFVGWLAIRKWREREKFTIRPYAIGALIFVGFFGFCVSFWTPPLIALIERYTGWQGGETAQTVLGAGVLQRVDWPAQFSGKFFNDVMDKLLAPGLLWRGLAMVWLIAGMVGCWRRNGLFLAVALMSLVVAIVAILTTDVKHFVAPRYVFHLLLFFVVFAAVAVVAFGEIVMAHAASAKRRDLAAVALAVAAAFLVGLYAPNVARQILSERQNWRGACRFIAERARPGDVVLTGPWGSDAAVRYYGRPLLTEEISIINCLSTAAMMRGFASARPGTNVWYITWGYIPDDLRNVIEKAMVRVAELGGLEGTVTVYWRGPG